MLKVGNLSCEIDSSACTINHQIGVAESSPFAGVQADIDELPFTQHCVDAALVSHCLEFCPDPHHLLREIDRVLIPDGHLLLTGFNPISLCGLAKLAYFNAESFPWSGRFFSASRIKDWLHLLGYEVLQEQRMMHCSFTRDANVQQDSRWQNFCQRHLSLFGSVYLIVARKRQLPLTPIKPKWRTKPVFNPATIKNALRR